VQTPTAFHGAGESQQAVAQTESFADLPWWQVFHDPKLQELIRTALKQNYDLQLAVERVNAARAQVGIVRSNQFPQVSLDPTFSGGKTTEGIKSNIFSLAADVIFQVDLFGRYRRATEAARAELLGTQDAQQTVILTLVSDVASDYFLLRDLDLQLQITKETVETQDNSVKLTELRLSHGVGTRLDVLQSRQVLDTANAQIPDLERQIGQTEDAINILLGNYPQEVPRGTALATTATSGLQWTETLAPQLPAGLPSTLLERRPDIRTAEQNLVAANANIGVAKAMFFPQLSLLGSGGAAFGHSAFLGLNLPAPLGIGSYAASAAQPIFNGGALRNNLRLAKSEERQALIGYQQTIQRAFGDVSDALIGYDKYHGVRERQEQTVTDLQESVDVSLMRYRGGTANYLDVLDSQRSLFQAELTLAQARNNEYQSMVQLYKALGGGWK
jgi:multidrug efflux system outer membrane protein